MTKPLRVLSLTSAKSGLKEIKEKMSKISLIPGQFSGVEILLEKGNVKIFHNNQDLANLDYVWLKSPWSYRSIIYTVSMYLEKYDVPFTDIETEKTKLTDTYMLADKNISIPKTYFCLTKQIKSNLDTISKFIKSPLIIKPVRGSKGKDIYLVNNKQELIKIIEKLNEKQKYLIQTFIPNDFDYRVIVVNGKAKSAEKRIRQDDEFRNNAALGAEEDFITVDSLPKEVERLAIDSAEVLGLDWCGVDIVVDKFTNQAYILEVNRFPGLTPGSTEPEAAMSFIKETLEEEGLID